MKELAKVVAGEMAALRAEYYYTGRKWLPFRAGAPSYEAALNDAVESIHNSLMESRP